MATLVRLSEEQINHLLEEMEAIERELKGVHEELVQAHVPKSALKRFEHMHDRYSRTAIFLRRQRELALGSPTKED